MGEGGRGRAVARVVVIFIRIHHKRNRVIVV